MTKPIGIFVLAVTLLSTITSAQESWGEGKRSITDYLLAQGSNRDASCVEACQSRHRTRVATCNTIFPPESRVREHRDCLDKAKTEFDRCLETC